jgi:hypothetical protein
MIEGIFGLPGKGKTYEGVRRLLLAADSGRQCYSVTPIDHPNVMQIEYEDVVDLYLPPGLIFLDEVHLVLTYTAWMKLDQRWFEKLSQTRKDGHDLLYTSQHESKVLKQLRDNTNYGWVCEAWGAFGGHPLAFTARCYEMHKLRRNKPADRYTHLFSKRVAQAYDTRYAIRANAAVTPKRGLVARST